MVIQLQNYIGYQQPCFYIGTEPNQMATNWLEFPVAKGCIVYELRSSAQIDWDWLQHVGNLCSYTVLDCKTWSRSKSDCCCFETVCLLPLGWWSPVSNSKRKFQCNHQLVVRSFPSYLYSWMWVRGGIKTKVMVQSHKSDTVFIPNTDVISHS